MRKFRLKVFFLIDFSNLIFRLDLIRLLDIVFNLIVIETRAQPQLKILVGWYGAVVKAPCPEACMRSGELCRLCVRNAQLTQLLDPSEKDVKIGCGLSSTSSALLPGAHSGGRVSPSLTGSAFSGGLPFENHPTLVY